MRGGWLLPAISSGIVTRDYLDAIRAGQYYCPHFDHKIEQFRCPNPPPKMVLLQIWKKAVYQKAKTEPQKDDLWNSMLATIKLIE